MSRPPHLPDAHLEQSEHDSLSRNISIFFITIVLALAAGVAGSLMVFAWVIPGGYMTEGQWVPRGQNSTITTPFVDPEAAVIRKVKNSTVEVFLAREILANGYYGRNAWVGDGVMLSSNGWGVVYAPKIANGSVPSLRMRDTQGTWYTPTSIVPDTVHGFIYFKLEGTEFYVASFPDWRIVESGMAVWVYERGSWKHQVLGARTYIDGSLSFRVSEERQRFELSPSGLSETGIVVSDTGNVLGFVDDEGRLHDAWMVEYSIPRLLGEGALTESVVDWTGSMVETIEEGKTVFGFLLESLGGSESTGLKRGDIIRTINGMPIDEYTVHRMIRATPVSLQVWRNGQISDILISE